MRLTHASVRFACPTHLCLKRATLFSGACGRAVDVKPQPKVIGAKRDCDVGVLVAFRQACVCSQATLLPQKHAPPYYCMHPARSQARYQGVQTNNLWKPARYRFPSRIFRVFARCTNSPHTHTGPRRSDTLVGPFVVEAGRRRANCVSDGKADSLALISSLRKAHTHGSQANDALNSLNPLHVHL